MINAKMVKIIGLVATAVGMGATLLTDWVNEKKMEEKIDERINESSPHLMTKRKSPNKGSFSLLGKLSCTIQRRLFRLLKNM